MIIDKDSVLHNIPTALNRRQALFIEAIKFSIEMADMAHRRLRETLLYLPKPDADPEKSSTVSAMLDAWSIVDSLHRLSALLQRMPGLKSRSRIQEIRAFLAATEKISELRNTLQHLDTEIPGVVHDNNWSVLGSLSWGVIDLEKNQVTAYTFISGIAMGSRPLINPMNRRQWHIPVDSITIERNGVAVCLSDAMRRVAALSAGLEENLARTYREQVPNPEAHHASDVILGVVISVTPEQIVPEGIPEREPELPTTCAASLGFDE